MLVAFSTILVAFSTILVAFSLHSIELTAAAVQVNYDLFIKPHIPGSVGCDLFVSGGGASNPFLMK